MLIFKYILPFILMPILSGQVKSIIIDNNDSLHVENIAAIEDTLISILHNEDQFGDSFELIEIGSSLKYLRKHNTIAVDTVLTIDKTLKPKVFLRMFESMIGTVPFDESKKQFDRIINSNAAFTDSSRIGYGLTNQKNIGAVINLNSKYNNYFSGIFGASNDNNTWTINGQIDIHLENQWRTANILDLHWKRNDEDSQLLQIFVEEPHPFDLPIGINLKYDQDLRDGNYLSSKSSVGIVKTVPGIAKIGFGANSTEISSTEQGDSLGVESLASKSIYINSIIDHRSDYWLPNKGHYFDINVTVGSRQINNMDKNIAGLTFNLQKYFSISSKISILTKFIGEGVWIEDGVAHIGEQAGYGGINTLRGYTEDIFESDWVMIPTIELSAKLSERQKVDLFTDIAFQNEYKELPFGYGIGFTQVSNNSVLKLYYALSRYDKFKNGKIHIQFLTLL